MKKNDVQKINNVEDLIKSVIKTPGIQRLLNDNTFYFQNLLDVKDKFFEYQISNSGIIKIIEDYETYKGTFEDFVIQSEDSAKPFLELLAEYISYLDKNASGKNRWNKYSDKRAIALAFVRMPHWVNYLLKLKINPDLEIKGSIKNAIEYSISPMDNLTVLSENHREDLSNKLLKREYNEFTFQEEIYEYFKRFGLAPKNKMNYTYIISSILYSPEIKSFWNSKEGQEKDNNEDNKIMPVTVNENLNSEEKKTSLNQIFFGPPGTGKTFRIIEDYITNTETHIEKVDSSKQMIDLKKGFWHLAPGEGGYLWDELKKDNYLGYEYCGHYLKDLSKVSKDEPSWDMKKRFSKVKQGDYFCIISGKKFYAIAQALHSYDPNLSKNSDLDFQTINVKWIKQFEKPELLNTSSLQAFSNLKGSKRWQSLLDALESQDIYPENKVGKEVKKSVKNYSLVSFHQSFSYEDFIEGIKPDLENEDDDENEIRYIIQDGIFKQSCDKAARLAGYEDLNSCIEDTKEGRQHNFHNAPPFYLLIDEINRGNISAIFGELITLIEKDKRLGNRYELMTDLPYSKKEFGVPANLYVIGTMNTADRSVEALDTALRRRFNFTEIKPSPELLEPYRIIYDILWEYRDVKWTNTEWVRIENGLRELFMFNEKWDSEKYAIWDKFNSAGYNVLHSKELMPFYSDIINFKKLLKTINKRIEILIDKDHQIGHSYFFKVKNFNDLVMVFQNNIIPLLEEYFYGDFGKIGLVIGSQFVDKINDKGKIDFADFNYDDKQALREKPIYKFTSSKDWSLKSFISIYDNSILKQAEQE